MIETTNPANLTSRTCDDNASYTHTRTSFLQKAHTTDVITMTILLALVSLAGSVGNALVIVVCGKYPTKYSAQRFVLAMAIIDLFVCVAIIPYRVLSYHRFLDERACKFFEALTYFTVLFSMFLLIAIAVDRYRAVCRATNYHKLANGTGVLILSIAVVTLLISIYPGVIAGHYVTIGSTDHTFQCFTGICNEDGQDRRFSTASAVFSYSVGFGIMYLTMVVTVIVCYAQVFRTLHSRYRRPKKLTKDSVIENSQPDASVAVLSLCEGSVDNDGVPASRLGFQFGAMLVQQTAPGNGARKGSTKRISHRRTAKILLLVTIAFIVTWLPFMLMKMHVVPNVVTLRLTFFISSMINPVIYSFTNKQFRENICKLLKGKPNSPR